MTAKILGHSGVENQNVRGFAVDDVCQLHIVINLTPYFVTTRLKKDMRIFVSKAL